MWLMDQPPLGHKAPRPGLGRLAFSSACTDFLQAPSPMSSRHFWFIHYAHITDFCRHVLEDCMAVETARQREGIRNFFDVCWHDGLSSETTYRYYISGLDSKGHSVPVKDHLSRGGSLLRLTEAWLDTWEPRDWTSCTACPVLLVLYCLWRYCAAPQALYPLTIWLFAD